MMLINEMNHALRHYFQSGATRPLDFRLQQLKCLETMLLSHEAEFLHALKLDLNKSPTESKLTEINIILEECRYAQKNLAVWMKPKTVHTPFPSLWRGKSTIKQQPYGVSLILAPWNFPLQLSLAPLVGAIAAGNCAVLKPSPLAKHTHDLLISLINRYFPPHYIQAIALSDSDCDQMFACPWDYVFFTGSPRVAKHVMSNIAPHLTPAALELGGKSPCIVDETADIQKAAQHIVWAKFLNAGQVCIAPDFIIAHESIRHELTQALSETIRAYYGEDPAKSPDYGRIINQAHYERLLNLLLNASVAHGGRHHDASRYIEPTLIDHLHWQDPLMQDEIFGPLLPIITYHETKDYLTELLKKPSPLALYVFSKNKSLMNTLSEVLSFGTSAVNTCLLQYSNIHLPFGGVGQSGMGRYHGKFSFDAFSYAQSCYERYSFPDITLHHPPFTARKLKWLWRLLKL